MPSPFHSPETTVRICDPRSAYPEVERLTLAQRPRDPAGARYCLVESLSPRGGNETPADAVEAEIRRRFPKAEITRFVRRDPLIDSAAERSEIIATSDAAIVFAGPASTMVHTSWRFAAELERAGLPAAVALSPAFRTTAEHTAATRAAGLRHCYTPSQGGGEDTLGAFAAAAVAALLAPVSDDEARDGRVKPSSGPPLPEQGEPEELYALFHELGLTDGLPFHLPTESAVRRMLEGTSRAPSEVVTAVMRPEGLETTVAMVAANAVMAGASPQHLPLILAAVSLYGDIQLESMTRSVNSFAFSHLVSAPLARRLGVKGALNALNPATTPNNVIARAIALTVRNCGAQKIGVTSTPMLGNPAGFLVFAENAEASPWEPFHVAEGLPPDAEAVTLFAGGFSMVGNFGYRGLDEAARLMTQFDSSQAALVLLSPLRAHTLAEQDFDRRRVIDHLWRNATQTLGEFRANGFFSMVRALTSRAAAAGTPPPWPEDYLSRPDEDVVPIYPRNGVKVVVTGGEGASVMQVWNVAFHITGDVSVWR